METANAGRLGPITDALVERLLIASAKRTKLLSEVCKKRILEALLVENARLLRERLRLARAASNRIPEENWNWLDAIIHAFSSKLIRPLAFVSMFAAVVTGYLLFGGSRLAQSATVSGRVSVIESRHGLFNSQWTLTRGQRDAENLQLHRGDELLATSPVTLTFADGSQTTAVAGTRIMFMTDQEGLILSRGEIANTIVPSGDGNPKFAVETVAGRIDVKGTVFRVQTGEDNGVKLFTDEGLVRAKNDKDEIDVAGGEQLQFRKGAKLVKELQVPVLTFKDQLPHAIMTNNADVPFSARIVANGVLVVIDDKFKPFARFVADDKGFISDKISFTAEGKYKFQFYQETPDGKLRSKPSEPIETQYDRNLVVLQTPAPRRDGKFVIVSGKTDVNNKVFVNHKEATVKTDGVFEFRLDASPNLKTVEVTSVDKSGNSMTVVHVLTY
jgi:hypothetical protein